ncbi:MAG TPA: type II toxin-antitoxin system RelE/ParE family toxin [Candidatus Hydrogenedentes bacterium]|nr:type II toxin-antitoxin system RelE/ParE family toxin [Candidatus Hydrogenedentota bacterium]
MPFYRVEYQTSAIRDLKKIKEPYRAKIVREIDKLAYNPRPVGAKKMSGFDQLYRIRVGDYRALYLIEDNVLVVLVLHAAHRREVYRG